MIHIDGYSTMPDKNEVIIEWKKRYEELEQQGGIRINHLDIGDTKNIYFGVIVNKNLTPLDILLLCHGEDLCFGGNVKISGNRFVAIVYTSAKI